MPETHQAGFARLHFGDDPKLKIFAGSTRTEMNNTFMRGCTVVRIVFCAFFYYVLFR